MVSAPAPPVVPPGAFDAPLLPHTPPADDKDPTDVCTSVLLLGWLLFCSSDAFSGPAELPPVDDPMTLAHADDEEEEEEGTATAACNSSVEPPN